MKLYLEKAKKEDIYTALKMLKEAAQWLKDENIDYWKHWLYPSEKETCRLSESFNKGEIYFVKTVGNVVIGMFSLQNEDDLLWENKSTNAAYVHLFTINRKYKNEGLGYKVLDLIENMLLEKNISVLRLDCASDNLRLCKYYEDYGFKLVKEKEFESHKLSLYEKYF